MLELPEGLRGYDQLAVSVDGKPVALPVECIVKGRIEVPLSREAEHVVRVQYACGGQNYWVYAPAGIDAVSKRTDGMD